MTKTKLKRVQSNDEDFDRLGGFVKFNKMPGDVGLIYPFGGHWEFPILKVEELLN